jgi:hypothetical protein
MEIDMCSNSTIKENKKNEINTWMDLV